MHEYRRTRRWYRPALLVGAVIAAVTAFALPAAASTTASTAAIPLSDTTTTVTLITGDQVTLRTSPQQETIRPAARGTTFQSYTDATGDHFVVPSVAQPYLGRQLDPSLFDVSALIRDGIGTSGRIPVRLAFATGVTPAAPPGVTITSVTGGSASGYVTAASGPALTAALRQQIGADIAAGHSAGTASLFGGLTGMSLAAAGPATNIVQPRFPLHILQFNATDITGQPAGFAFVVLLDTDSGTRVDDIVPIVDGIARVAVPAGNYTAVAFFADFDASGNATASRTVTLVDFTVAASGTTTESMDERTATSKISATTPRPATQDYVVTTFSRFDSAGIPIPFFLSGLTFGSVPTFVNAQPAAKVGSLRYVVQWGGQPTTEPSDPYRFDAAFGADDIPADEAFAVRPNQLATVHQRFSADPAGPGGTLTSGVGDPVAGGGIAIGGPSPVPGNLTQYLGTADGGTWFQSLFATNQAAFFGDNRTFAPTRNYSIDWQHGPLVAGFGQHTGLQFCAVCVAGNTFVLGFANADDSEPDHAGFSPANTHFTLSANGTVIVDAPGATGAEVTGIPATPTTYRAVLDNDLTGVPGFSQSTVTHTDLTVQYRPGTDPALPATDFCNGRTPTTPCAILPALDLDYQLATDESNTSHSPVQVLGLHVGHATFDGVGSRSRITSVSVSVSFNGGTTWQPAIVLGSNGSYVATWRNRAGASPTIKVTAADANGDSIAQTISNAYTIAGPR